jgi:hypothetical protein
MTGVPALSNNRSHLVELSVVFSPNHLAQPLTPYPLPTKDGGVLRTIGDARAYMLALPKEREWLDHWKAAYRLLVRGANAASLPGRFTSPCPWMASLTLKHPKT